jgi:hypothetical protein
MTMNLIKSADRLLNLDQIRNMEFGEGNVATVTWQDGKHEKLTLNNREIASLRYIDPAPPTLLPAAPGFELIRFDPPWRVADDAIAAFDIAAALQREPVIAWDITAITRVEFGTNYVYRRNAIGCGALRLYGEDFWGERGGRCWTALILPTGVVFDYPYSCDYFNREYLDDTVDWDNRKPTSLVYDTFGPEYFESIPKWIDYVRKDWKAFRRWSDFKKWEDDLSEEEKAARKEMKQRKWEKDKAESDRRRKEKGLPTLDEMAAEFDRRHPMAAE